jgi:diacylglycerol kinase (ATP)
MSKHLHKKKKGKSIETPTEESRVEVKNTIESPEPIQETIQEIPIEDHTESIDQNVQQIFPTQTDPVNDPETKSETKLNHIEPTAEPIQHSISPSTDPIEKEVKQEISVEPPPTPTTPIDPLTPVNVQQVDLVQIPYKKVGFVINPTAGRGRVLKSFQSQILPILKQKFQCEICCFLTKSKGDGIRLAKKYVESGYDMIVSVGGDGTNHEVVNGIMQCDLTNKNIALGIFPLGSGCDFARTIQTLVDGYTIPCDVGSCECTGFDGISKVQDYFLNISSFGASGQIMKNVNSSPMIINHEITYMWHTLATSLFTPNSDISLDGKRFKTYITSICNGQYYGNNLWVNPYGNIGDGAFDVIVMEDFSFNEVLHAIGKIKTGDHLIVPKVYQDKSRSEVEAITHQKAHVVIECDGELTGILPAKWKIVNTPFRLVVPKDFKYKK